MPAFTAARAARDVVVALRVARLAPHDHGDEVRVAAERQGAERRLRSGCTNAGLPLMFAGRGAVGAGRRAEVLRHLGEGAAAAHLEVDEAGRRQARRLAAVRALELELAVEIAGLVLPDDVVEQDRVAEAPGGQALGVEQRLAVELADDAGALREGRAADRRTGSGGPTGASSAVDVETFRATVLLTISTSSASSSEMPAAGVGREVVDDHVVHDPDPAVDRLEQADAAAVVVRDVALDPVPRDADVAGPGRDLGDVRGLLAGQHDPAALVEGVVEEDRRCRGSSPSCSRSSRSRRRTPRSSCRRSRCGRSRSPGTR